MLSCNSLFRFISVEVLTDFSFKYKFVISYYR